MTVRFIAPLATNTTWGCFTKLLFKWRGSVYKAIWIEYLVFITLYYLVFFVYRYGFNEEQQRYFEKVALYCESSKGPVEMAFILGFFVTTIVRNWWHIYQLIPRPDTIAHYVNVSVKGYETRRTIVRYFNLCLALTFRTISPTFKQRFPTLESLIQKGLLLENEKTALNIFDNQSRYGYQLLPVTWASELISGAKNEGKILEEMDKFRRACAMLLDYENFSVPLMYVQVVTISVYSYFMLCLVGRQWLINDDKYKNLNLYFPFYTTYQFIFHMGWFKIAESLINPFGNDDDDFELKDLMDRTIKLTELMLNDNEELSSVALKSSKFDSGVLADEQYHNYVNIGSLRLPPPRFSEVMAADLSHRVGSVGNLCDYHPTYRSRSPLEHLETGNFDETEDSSRL